MSKIDKSKLLQFIQSSLVKDKKIDENTLLFKERLLDSMNILDLIGFVEKQLGRKLKDEEIIMANFQSVSNMTKAFNNEQ